MHQLGDEYTDFWSDHLKWDHGDSIGALKPGVVPDAGTRCRDAQAYLRAAYVPPARMAPAILVRARSPKIVGESPEAP